MVVFVFALWACSTEPATAQPAKGRIAASAPKGSVWDQQWDRYKSSFAAMMTTTFEGFEKQRLDVRVAQDGEIQRIIDEGDAVSEPTSAEQGPVGCSRATQPWQHSRRAGG